MLNDKEIEILCILAKAYSEGVIQDCTQDYDFDDEKSLIDPKKVGAILKKLYTILGQEQKKDIDLQVISRKYGDWNREPDTAIINLIANSIVNKKIMEIVYYSPDKEKLSKRNVAIYAQNARYIVGYCHLAKDIRKFRKSRIVRAAQTKGGFEVPPSFNKKDYL